MRTWWGGNKRLTFSWARCNVWSFCRVRSAHPQLPVTVGRWGNRARGLEGQSLSHSMGQCHCPQPVLSPRWLPPQLHRECTDPQLCCTSPTAQPSHQLSPGGGWWHRRRTLSPSHAPSSHCRDLCRGEGAGVATRWFHPLSPLKPQPQHRLRCSWRLLAGHVCWGSGPHAHGWPGRFTRCSPGDTIVCQSPAAPGRELGLSRGCPGTAVPVPARLRHCGCTPAWAHSPATGKASSCGGRSAPCLHGAARRGLCTGPGLGQGAGALAAAHSPPAPTSPLGLSSVSFLTQGSCRAPGQR